MGLMGEVMGPPILPIAQLPTRVKGLALPTLLVGSLLNARLLFGVAGGTGQVRLPSPATTSVRSALTEMRMRMPLMHLPLGLML